MCGIAGIVGRKTESNRSALRRMTAAMAHRGPDGEGLWEGAEDSQGRTVMLGHRRLSILDLSSSGAQPMVDPVTGHVVVLNGEIYNFAALRGELSSAGQRFQSSGDTAVMLRLLSLHGHAAISRLRGMFAFAWWNSEANHLTLARDPLGIKPLYLARNPDPGSDWSVAFASEVRGILASGLLGRPRLNPAAVASVAWNGFVVSPETAVAGVESIWPGEFRVIDLSGAEAFAQDYWSMRRSPHAGRTGEAELTQSLEECVRLHLASDVPLGVFLSGGVDSSAVANLAQKASDVPVHTFTLAFEEDEYNEGPIARRVADAIGTRHQEIVLTERTFIESLEPAVDSLDQPTFDGLNSYYMSHAVREAGFKVALVGTGGDELFGGYTSFRDLPLLSRWSKAARFVPTGSRVALARLISSMLQPSAGEVPPQTRWAKLPEIARRQGDLVSLYQLAYALFLPDFQRQLLGAQVKDALDEGLPTAMRARLSAETRQRSALSAISVMELRLFLGERLLRDTDAASMSASIEVRLPLVDRMLFESIDRLPDRLRFEPLRTKAMLRRIGLSGLDRTLFERPKSGFVLPFDRWIRAGLGKVMDQTLSDSTAVLQVGLEPEAVRRLWRAFLDGASGLYWSRVWAVYALIRWCHRYQVFV